VGVDHKNGDFLDETATYETAEASADFHVSAVNMADH